MNRMPKPAAKWRRRKEARPTEILTAALDSFAERGYAGTKLDDVAKRAGVTKGTLYLYFPNKEELFKAVVREALAPRVAGLADPSATVSATELIGTIVTNIAGLAASPIGAIPKLILAEAGNFPELARFYHDEVIARGLKAVRATLRRGVKSGEFREIDVDHVCYCVVAPLLLGVLWKQTFERYAGKKLDLAVLARAHLDVLLDGIRRRKAA
jgi:AcrR family transcriptional regulator